MVSPTIFFFTFLLIICYIENVKSPSKSRYNPVLTECLDMISQDFEWKRKNHHNLNKLLPNQALLKKKIGMMNIPYSFLYFGYLREQMYLGPEGQNLETLSEYCRSLAEYCSSHMAKYFLHTVEENIIRLSDDKLQVAKDVYNIKTKADFDCLEPTDLARIYYEKMIKFIKFKDDLLRPFDYCLSTFSYPPSVYKKQTSMRNQTKYNKKQQGSSFETGAYSGSAQQP